MIGQVALLELTPNVLEWINDAIPNEVDLGTLVAIHPASCIVLLEQGQELTLASYGSRMNAVATILNIPLSDL